MISQQVQLINEIHPLWCKYTGCSAQPAEQVSYVDIICFYISSFLTSVLLQGIVIHAAAKLSALWCLHFVFIPELFSHQHHPHFLPP